ncbi:MAG: DNA polymerase III subunit alpha, partial [bacterium]|nr:DNA polymerase III subunit alpha [bacterium]
MGKFTHLHVHSHFSLLDGLPKIDQLLDRAKELGMDSLAVTDHGNLYGAVEFYKKAKERGIKPIIGAEIYLAFEGMEQKRPKIDDAIYHMVLLVKDEEGYVNLVKILTEAHLKGFYYKPRVDEEFLARHAKGLIALSACLNGKVPRLLLSKKGKEAEAQALKYQEIFGKGNFYLELQDHPNIPEQKTVNEGLLKLAEKSGIPLVATADSHYLKPEDAEAQDVLMLINTGARPDDPERLTLTQDDFSLKSAEEMAELFKEVPEAVLNTQKIADSCNLKLEIGTTRLPVFPLPEGKGADEYLRELCLAGLQEKPELLNDPAAMDRLDYELSIIKQTGFAPYFLIVQDFVTWAKQKRIVVGPGRGSVGGSLAAYLLKITNINPLQYNLLFERFLTAERVSMPDIDLDFADYRRDEVIRYVADKYGSDHVAQIITFGTMAARAVVRDVGRALGYEYSYCDRVAKMIPFSHTLQQALEEVEEFKELYTKDEKAKRLIDLGQKLEGVARHASTHACGVVIAAQPLDTIVPLQHPTQNDEHIVTQYEMHSIEDLGLLKMDFLGLKNLSVIEDTLKRIYVIYGKNVDIDRIPQDDPKVYKLFAEANTIGIFQVESEGMRRYLRELKPTEFEDIIAMIALYRPGPMELIPDYIARKHGRKKITYLHAKLEPILKTTQGICIYQEQLMRIAQDLAGFSLSDADVLRKAVGTKIKSLLEEQQEKFVSGMVKNGVEQRVANQLWEWVLPFARYGFNKSHSAAYATIAYQTAWLKTHYPVEFMSALLTAERNDVERIAFLIEEARKMGIEVLPPGINESFSNFSVVPQKNQIRFGLLAVKNVGEGIVEAIIAERKARGTYLSMQDFITRISSTNLNKKSLESLIKAGAFDAFAGRNKLLFNL